MAQVMVQTFSGALLNHLQTDNIHFPRCPDIYRGRLLALLPSLSRQEALSLSLSLSIAYVSMDDCQSTQAQSES